MVEQTCVESKDHVFDMLKEVEAHGGEGLMLRKPGSKYEGRRSSTLLKIKVSDHVDLLSTVSCSNLFVSGTVLRRSSMPKPKLRAMFQARAGIRVRRGR